MMAAVRKPKSSAETRVLDALEAAGGQLETARAAWLLHCDDVRQAEEARLGIAPAADDPRLTADGTNYSVALDHIGAFETLAKGTRDLLDQLTGVE